MMRSRRHIQILSVATLLALGLTACGTGTTADSSAESAPTPSPIARADDVSTAVGEPSGKVVEEGSRTPRLAITHDEGVIVLDAVTLELLGEFPSRASPGSTPSATTGT